MRGPGPVLRLPVRRRLKRLRPAGPATDCWNGQALGEADIGSYLRRIRESWQASREPGPETGPHAYAIYLGTALWCFGWWQIAPHDRPHHWFKEGAAIDMLSSVFLATAGVLAWTAGILSKGTKRRTFWLLCALGLLFFAVDERLGLHERAHNDWLLDAYGDAPFGVRNWNDLIVAGYGVIALLGAALCLPAFVRFRRTRNLLIAGFVFFLAHSAIDTLFEHTLMKMVWEESCKALAGASFAAAFLHGVLYERHDREKRGDTRPVLRWKQAIPLLAVAAVIAAVVLAGGREYQRWLRNHWGSTHSWVVAVFWMGSAILLFAAWLERPRAPFRLAASAFAWIVGVGESWRATRAVFRHEEMDGVWPTTIRTDFDLMHEPLELEGYLFFGGLAVLVFWGVHALRAKGTAGWFLAAAALSAASLPVNAQLGEWGNNLGAPVLRILGGACLLFGSIRLLLTSAEAAASAQPAPSTLS